MGVGGGLKHTIEQLRNGKSKEVGRKDFAPALSLGEDDGPAAAPREPTLTRPAIKTRLSALTPPALSKRGIPTCESITGDGELSQRRAGRNRPIDSASSAQTRARRGQVRNLSSRTSHGCGAKRHPWGRGDDPGPRSPRVLLTFPQSLPPRPTPTKQNQGNQPKQNRQTMSPPNTSRPCVHQLVSHHTTSQSDEEFTKQSESSSSGEGYPQGLPLENSRGPRVCGPPVERESQAEHRLLASTC